MLLDMTWYSSCGRGSTGASSTPSLARWERVKASQLVRVTSRPYTRTWHGDILSVIFVMSPKVTTRTLVPMLRSVQCQYSRSAPCSRQDTPPIHTLSSINLEAAVLGDPVPLDEDALVEAGVVQPRLHQAQRVVLQVVEQLHAPHAPSLRPHPVRDNLVEVAEEPENLV